MRLFGREIKLSVTAAAPRKPSADTAHTPPAAHRGEPVYFPPFIRPDQGPDEFRWQRVVTSDPREAWYLALPNKLLPRQVEQIKRAGLGGDLWQQWQLEALMSDSWPMYRKCAHEVRQAVAGSRWIVRPYAAEGEEPTAKAEEKAALVRRSLVAMKPDRFSDEKGFRGLVYNLCDALLNGISMCELLWNKQPDATGALLPRAATWIHPRHYTFSDAGKVSILGNSDVGSTLQFNGRPNQLDMSQPDMLLKFMCAQYSSRSGSALAGGLVRPLAPWWSYWIYGREWIAVMAQKHGTPFLKGKYQSGSMTDTELSKLEGRLRDAGANNYALIPSNAELEVVAAQTLGADNPIVSLMRQADEAPQYLLLGQTGTTTATPGKLGNDDAHGDVKKEHIQALAEWAGSVLTEQWATAVLVANYGDDEECPTIEADFTEVASPEKQATRWQALTGMNMPPVMKSEFYKENSLTEPKPGDEVVKDGKVTIMEEAMSDDERFARDLDRQVQQAEAQMELQAEAAGGSPAQAKDQKPDVRKVLAKATDAELAELEAAVKAAETAPHRNGEVKAVAEKVRAIGSRRCRKD